MVLSDIVAGLFVVKTNGAVVGRLARIAANGTTGKPEAVPPGDTVPFGPYYQVIDANSANASLLPLDPFNMTRLPLSSTCAIGDAPAAERRVRDRRRAFCACRREGGEECGAR